MTSPRPRTLDAQAVQLSSCPAPPDGCGTRKGARCRAEDGRSRSHPHPARTQLAAAIMRELSRAHFLGSTTWPAARLDAWHAARDWDHREAEDLRLWLSAWGPLLWSARPPGGGLCTPREQGAG